MPPGRSVGVVLIMALSLVSGVGGCTIGTGSGTSSGFGSASSSPTGMSWVGPGSGPNDPSGSSSGFGLDQPPAAALGALLTERSEALRWRDRGRWAATIADPAGADGVAELAAYDALVALGVQTLTMAAPSALTPLSEGTATGRTGWRASVSLTYRLPEIDRGLRTANRTVTVVADRERWRIGRWVGPSDAWELWDLPDLRTARTGDVLVVGNVSVETLTARAAEAQAAVQRVAAVFGQAGSAVIVVPSTAAQAARLLGRASEADVATLAASAQGPRAPDLAATADRVVLNPVAMGALTDLGRRVVLTHELAHVTMRATTARDTPLWLSEGLAEWVAYQHSGLPPTLIAGSFLQQVRTAGPPSQLPSDVQFDAARPDAALAYQGAWLAATRIAEQHGPDRLLEFYRRVAGTPGVPASGPAALVLADAFAAALGTDEATFTEAWRVQAANLARA